MPRPRQLPENGYRRTITFNRELDERLAVIAAQRRTPVSVLIEELVLRGLEPPPTPESLAATFPSEWDGADLRERLYYLRMRQADLAKALRVPMNTVNNWIRGAYHFPPEMLPEIQKALRKHIPGPIHDFRAGPRSPRL